MNKREYLTELLRKGVEKTVKESSVSMETHVRVLTALHNRLKERDKAHKELLDELHRRIIEKGQKGEMGPRGPRGESVQGERGTQGLPGRDGLQGRDGAKGEKGEEGTVDLDMAIDLLLARIQTEKLIDVSHIKNMPVFKMGKTKYKVEELMHGGATGFQSPTGTVNGVNKVFTFKSAPNIIVVDQGRAMQQTSSDGTVNWTVSGATITLTIAPTYDIFATA